ncbi:MAG: ComF family protein [Candidatus Pacebacteria bacterium]|nr:ComF family protein [Candidatus Paceibacterota bacterium]
MWMFSTIVDILFPSRCFVCHKKDGTALCSACLQSKRRAISTPAPWIHSHFAYHDIRHIIHAIKYYRRKDLVDPLVRATLTQDLHSHLEGLVQPTLVPIPTPTLRRLSRGYNQAEVIAKAYANYLSLPCSSILHRRNSARKVKLGSRHKRLHASITMHVDKKELVHGKDIILVDDVTTTGATLFEAHRILKQAGARTVRAITLAH